MTVDRATLHALAIKAAQCCILAMLVMSFPAKSEQGEGESYNISFSAGLYQVFAEASDPSHIRSDASDGHLVSYRVDDNSPQQRYVLIGTAPALPFLIEGKMTVIGVGARDQPRIDLDILDSETARRFRSDYGKSRLVLLIDGEVIGIYDALDLLSNAADQNILDSATEQGSSSNDEILSLEKTIKIITGILSIVGGLIAIAIGIFTFRLKEIFLRKESRITVAPDREELEKFGKIFEKFAQKAADTLEQRTDFSASIGSPGHSQASPNIDLQEGVERVAYKVETASDKLEHTLEGIVELLNRQGGLHARLLAAVERTGQESLEITADMRSSVGQIQQTTGKLSDKLDSLRNYPVITVAPPSHEEHLPSPSEVAFRVKIDADLLRALLREAENEPTLTEATESEDESSQPLER